jgi:hypothetical protein
LLLVVDGSNIGKSDPTSGGRIDLRVLNTGIEALRERYVGADVVTVIDRSDALRHDLPQAVRREIRAGFEDGRYLEPPVNVSGGDDHCILQIADQMRGKHETVVVVSNDAYRPHTSDFPWLLPADGRPRQADLVVHIADDRDRGAA